MTLKWHSSLSIFHLFYQFDEDTIMTQKWHSCAFERHSSWCDYWGTDTKMTPKWHQNDIAALWNGVQAGTRKTQKWHKNDIVGLFGNLFQRFNIFICIFFKKTKKKKKKKRRKIPTTATTTTTTTKMMSIGNRNSSLPGRNTSWALGDDNLPKNMKHISYFSFLIKKYFKKM